MTADAQIPTYEEFMARFRVEDITDLLAGDLRTGLNACYECCDRHAQPGRVALYWEGKDGQRATYTFAELQELSARFANFLRAQGVQPGDRVAGLLPRIPELLVVILGTWRAGAVYQTLFTAFGPKAIEYRVGRSEAKLVVTDEANRSKLDGVAGRRLQLPHRARPPERQIRASDADGRGPVHAAVHLRHRRAGQGRRRVTQGVAGLLRLHALRDGRARRRRLLERGRPRLGL